jgi:hypothetical protein
MTPVTTTCQSLFLLLVNNKIQYAKGGTMTEVYMNQVPDTKHEHVLNISSDPKIIILY